MLPDRLPTPTLDDELIDREARIAILQDQIARVRAELAEADSCFCAGLYGPSHVHLKGRPAPAGRGGAMTWLRRSLGHATPEDRSRYHEQAAAVIAAHPERESELLPADPVEAAYVQGGRRYRQLLAELTGQKETPS